MWYVHRINNDYWFSVFLGPFPLTFTLFYSLSFYSSCNFFIPKSIVSPFLVSFLNITSAYTDSFEFLQVYIVYLGINHNIREPHLTSERHVQLLSKVFARFHSFFVFPACTSNFSFLLRSYFCICILYLNLVNKMLSSPCFIATSIVSQALQQSSIHHKQPPWLVSYIYIYIYSIFSLGFSARIYSFLFS